jgi:hypothetical protein
MTRRPTLWLPGTDHAGIATQNVVEKKLRKEGKDKRDIGREAFVEETWKVAKEHKAIILRQLAKIGSSVDWTRERFTLDEGLSRAVREVFVSLYERGLIYKGEYLVNWCTSCGTAISDDEVEHDDEPGSMWHIWYELAEGPSLNALRAGSKSPPPGRKRFWAIRRWPPPRGWALQRPDRENVSSFLLRTGLFPLSRTLMSIGNSVPGWSK